MALPKKKEIKFSSRGKAAIIEYNPVKVTMCCNLRCYVDKNNPDKLQFALMPNKTIARFIIPGGKNKRFGHYGEKPHKFYMFYELTSFDNYRYQMKMQNGIYAHFCKEDHWQISYRIKDTNTGNKKTITAFRDARKIPNGVELLDIEDECWHAIYFS